MNLKKILELVAEFQNATDQPVNQSPTLGDFKHSKLRFDLMKEENKEYLAALKEGDLVEVLDAVVDELYILAGTINNHGLQNVFEAAFERVHENNMTKVVDGKVLRNPDGKILKPAGFKPVVLTDLIQ